LFYQNQEKTGGQFSFLENFLAFALGQKLTAKKLLEETLGDSPQAKAPGDNPLALK
jgi:hypothetical protein